MSFSTETLTIIGAQFLAQATSGNRLVIAGCNAYTTVYSVMDAQTISSVPSGELSTTTDATLIGSVENHVQIRATFHVGTSAGGDANTLMVYGYLENDPGTVVVIYVSSDSETFHLPLVTDIATVFECLFDISYNASPDSVTSATDATYTSLTEFRALKERVVTTHSEGNPSAGDDQYIYGKKTFSSIVANSFSTNQVQNENGSLILRTKTSGGNSWNAIEFGYEQSPSNNRYIQLNTNEIIPASSYYTSLGTVDLPWQSVFSGELHAVITNDEYTETSTQNLIFAGNTKNNNSGCLLIKSYYHYEGSFGSYGNPDESRITIGSTLNGVDGNPLTDIYIDFYNDTSTSLIEVKSNYNQANAVFKVNTYVYITSTVRIDGKCNMYGGCSITGNCDMTGDLTVSGNLTVSGIISGITPDTSTTIPIGSLALILISPIQTLTHYNAGEVLDSNDLSSSVSSVYFAKTKTSSTNGYIETDTSNLRQVTITSGMKFTLLNDIQSNQKSLALVMRIA